MAELKTVMLTSIDHNPHRDTDRYPYDKAKLAALTRSMEDVGCWEGIIARKVGRRYEVAFGHHRLKAAEQAGLSRIPLVIRDLSDDDMLKFMGRENGEDYRAQFLVLLETWDAAARHNAPTGATTAETARFLGWTDARGRGNKTAEACAAASKLLKAKHIKRSDLVGLSVRDARDLCQHAVSRMKQIEQIAHKTGQSSKDTEKVKRAVAEGVKRTADGVRSGDVAQKKIRSELDGEAYRAGKDTASESPLFAAFASRVAGDLARMLAKDTASEKLKEMVKALPKVEQLEDKQTIEKVQFHLEKLADRAENWRDKLYLDKVSPINKPKLKALPGGAS